MLKATSTTSSRSSSILSASSSSLGSASFRKSGSRTRFKPETPTTKLKKLLFNQLLDRPEFKEAIQTNLRSGRTVDRIYEGTKRLADSKSTLHEFILEVPPELKPFHEICSDPIELKAWLYCTIKWSITNQFDEHNILTPQLGAVLNSADNKLTLPQDQKLYRTKKLLCQALITEHAPFESPAVPSADTHLPENRAQVNKHMFGMKIIQGVLTKWVEAPENEDDEKLFHSLRTGETLSPNIDNYFDTEWQKTLQTEREAPNTSRNPKILAKDQTIVDYPRISKRSKILVTDPPPSIKTWIMQHKLAFGLSVLFTLVFIAGLTLTLIVPGGQPLGMSMMWWSTGAMALTLQLTTAIAANAMQTLQRKKLVTLGVLLFAAGCIMLFAFPGTQLLGLILMSFGSTFVNASARTEVKAAFGKKWIIAGLISFVTTVASLVTCLIPSLGIIPWVAKILDFVAPATEMAKYLSADAITVLCINLVGLVVNGILAFAARVRGSSAPIVPVPSLSAPTDSSSPSAAPGNTFVDVSRLGHKPSSRVLSSSSSSFSGSATARLAAATTETRTIEALGSLAEEIADELKKDRPDEETLRVKIKGLVTELNSINNLRAISDTPAIGLSSILRPKFHTEPRLKRNFESVFSTADVKATIPEEQAIARFKVALENLNSPVLQSSPSSTGASTDGDRLVTTATILAT
ncbi:hypothetical protein BH10PSE19_BH10PSE19_02350 [soil metagenome]